MTSGSIFSNENSMANAASSFNSYARDMQNSRSTLKRAGDELSAAWQGGGADRFESLKNLVDAYCVKMSEITFVEAENIRAASRAYTDADAMLSGQLSDMGQ